MSSDKVHLPKASQLMGTLRCMGYSFESAIADIIDNSISAHATVVKVRFPMTPLEDLALGIIDNGDGMSKEHLLEAMRYGYIAPEDIRPDDDLGRFGMGLKSASLSQCRRLTVVSFDGNSYVGFRWDYAYILKKNNWIIQELDADEIRQLPYFNEYEEQHKGTLVIWQDLDVISKSSDGQVFDALQDLMVPLEKHLSLTFHRFLSDRTVLCLYINKLQVDHADPFLEHHPKTTCKKERTIAVKDSNGIERLIYIKPFILPYATDLKDKDKKLVGGIENLRAKQGFYVYRNKRLIIHGTWFGMKPRAELTKNARVRVDIPNSLDDIWAIDIKKQQASIPKLVQNQLKKTVREALDISLNQQTYRGRTNKANDNIDYIWERKEGRHSSFFYKINRESKLYQFIREKMTDEDLSYLEMLVTEIEKNIPLQQMYIDKSNEVITDEDCDSRFDDVYQLAYSMAIAIQKIHNINFADAVDDIMKSEPFCYHPELKQLLLKNTEDEHN